jgi:O-antigen/teichoic acid export membrane protein
MLALLLAARRLGPSSFGTLSIGYVLVRYLGLIADDGAGFSGARDVAKGDGAVDVTLVRRRQALGLALGVVFSVGAAAAGKPELAGLGVVVVAAGLSRDWVALGRGHSVRSAAPGLARGGLALAGVAGVHSLGATANALGAAALVGALASLLLNPVDRDGGRTSAAHWMLVAVISAQIYSTADTLLLGLLDGTREAGIYAAVYRLPLVWFTVVTLHSQSLVRDITLEVAGGAPDAARAASERIVRTGLQVAAVPLVLALATPALVVPLLGEGYADGRGPLAALWVAMALVTVTAPLSVVALARIGDRAYARILGLGAVTNIALNLVAIPVLGALGAGLTTIAAEGVVLGLFLRELRAPTQGSAPGRSSTEPA